MPDDQFDALLYGYDYRYAGDRYYIDDLPEPKSETGDVNYVYLKGKGWVPETSNVKKLIADQEQEAFNKRIQEQQERIRLRQRARTANFGFNYGRADMEQRVREMTARLREETRLFDWYTAPAGNQANTPTQPAETVTWTTQTQPAETVTWTTQTQPAETVTWTTQTQFIEDDWYGTRRLWGDTTERWWGQPTDGRPVQIPREPREHPHRAAEPVATRYYPGSGVRAEAAPAPTETPAERRVREWMEARRRWGRR